MGIERKFLYVLNDVDEKYILEAQEAVQKARQTAQIEQEPTGDAAACNNLPDAKKEADEVDAKEEADEVDVRKNPPIAAEDTDTCGKRKDTAEDTDKLENIRAAECEKKQAVRGSRRRVRAWACAAAVFCTFLGVGTAIYLQGMMYTTEDRAFEEEVSDGDANVTVGEEPGDTTYSASVETSEDRILTDLSEFQAVVELTDGTLIFNCCTLTINSSEGEEEAADADGTVREAADIAAETGSLDTTDSGILLWTAQKVYEALGISSIEPSYLPEDLILYVTDAEPGGTIENADSFENSLDSLLTDTFLTNAILPVQVDGVWYWPVIVDEEESLCTEQFGLYYREESSESVSDEIRALCIGISTGGLVEAAAEISYETQDISTIGDLELVIGVWRETETSDGAGEEENAASISATDEMEEAGNAVNATDSTDETENESKNESEMEEIMSSEIYVAEFAAGGVGYRIVSLNLTQEEFIRVLLSLSIVS